MNAEMEISKNQWRSTGGLSQNIVDENEIFFDNMLITFFNNKPRKFRSHQNIMHTFVHTNHCNILRGLRKISMAYKWSHYYLE